MDKKDFLTDDAKYILNLLEKHDHTAYIVGGAVRDKIIGYSKQSFLSKGGDYDIATSATSDTVMEIFSDHRLILDGVEYGTVKVLLNDIIYEVTTFREDGDYSDGRRPDNVLFTDDIVKDLSRRDFTINAMALNSDGVIIDPFGGQRDLRDRIVRTVGDPNQRYKEDYLRMLRCIRFATVLGFTIDPDTSDAIRDIQQDSGDAFVRHVSSERIQKEIKKILSNDPYRGMELLRKHHLLDDVTPIANQIGFDQQHPNHPFTLYYHTLSAMSFPSNWMVRMALMGHDTGKIETQKPHPRKPSQMSYFDHASVSEDIMSEYLDKLAFPTVEKEHILNLVRHHMIPFTIVDGTASDVALRRWIKRVTSRYKKEDGYKDRAIKDLIDVAMGDALGKTKTDVEGLRKRMKQLDALYERVKSLTDKKEKSSSDRVVDGYDVMDLGLEGKQVGAMLEEIDLFDPDTREDAMQFMDFILHDPDAIHRPTIAKNVGSNDAIVDEIIARRRIILGMDDDH